MACEQVKCEMAVCAKRVGWPAKVAVALGVVLALAFGVAKVLPPHTGWENGLLEVVQNVGLFVAGVVSLWQASRLKAPPSRALLWIAAMFWFVFMGREMSWGAVLLSPSSWSEHAGPLWSSRALLWYRPAVPWVVGGLLLVAIALGVRFRAWRALATVGQRRQLPWAALGLFVLSFVLASLSEGKGPLNLLALYGQQAVVLEELLETLGYVALWLAQQQVFWALRAAQAQGLR